MSLADDWFAINNAIATYVVAVDTRDMRLLDQVFTKDARIDLATVGVLDPAAYAELCNTVLPGLDATQHHLGLPVIAIEGDKAQARTYFIAQHTRNALAPDPHFLVGGWYDDEFARTAEGWRITSRTGTAAWFDGNAQVLGQDIPAGAPPRTAGHAAPAWLIPR